MSAKMKMSNEYILFKINPKILKTLIEQSLSLMNEGKDDNDYLRAAKFLYNNIYNNFN